MSIRTLFSLALVAQTLAAPAPQGITLSDSIKQQPIQMCGKAQNVVLTDTPWIVYNMFYNQAQTKGSMCTGYDSVSTGANGNKNIKWSAVTDIDYVKATYDINLSTHYLEINQVNTTSATTSPKATLSSA
jgi:hypothetical protein